MGDAVAPPAVLWWPHADAHGFVGLPALPFFTLFGCLPAHPRGRHAWLVRSVEVPPTERTGASRPVYQGKITPNLSGTSVRELEGVGVWRGVWCRCGGVDRAGPPGWLWRGALSAGVGSVASGVALTFVKAGHLQLASSGVGAAGGGGEPGGMRRRLSPRARPRGGGFCGWVGMGHPALRLYVWAGAVHAAAGATYPPLQWRAGGLPAAATAHSRVGRP